MARLRFNRGVGLVHAGLALVPGRTVVEHLVLFYRYHLTEPRRTLAARAIRLVRSMGLCAADRQDLRKVHSEWLEERTLRIGLYAVALAKSPWLFVLESPGAFLGKDFPPLWERIGSERRERGAAVLVLDRSEEGYGEGAFRSVARLGGPAS
jgi:hypothetical protein